MDSAARDWKAMGVRVTLFPTQPGVWSDFPFKNLTGRDPSINTKGEHFFQSGGEWSTGLADFRSAPDRSDIGLLAVADEKGNVNSLGNSNEALKLVVDALAPIIIDKSFSRIGLGLTVGRIYEDMSQGHRALLTSARWKGDEDVSELLIRYNKPTIQDIGGEKLSINSIRTWYNELEAFPVKNHPFVGFGFPMPISFGDSGRSHFELPLARLLLDINTAPGASDVISGPRAVEFLRWAACEAERIAAEEVQN